MMLADWVLGRRGKLRPVMSTVCFPKWARTAACEKRAMESRSQTDRREQDSIDADFGPSGSGAPAASTVGMDDTAVPMKTEPTAESTTDTHDQTFWASIFEENGDVMELLEDDVDAAYEEAQASGSVESMLTGCKPLGIEDSVCVEPSLASSILEQWHESGREVMDFDHGDTMGGSFQLSAPSHEGLRAPGSMPRTDVDVDGLGPLLLKPEPTAAGIKTPLRVARTVSLGNCSNGSAMCLSKPIIRDDGIALVGTESTSGGSSQHCIYIVNSFATQRVNQVASIPVCDEVRDLHWINSETALTAVGKDIQLISIGTTAGERACRLHAPMNRAHSDTIRELAVPRSSSFSCILSGGFDETVCLIHLGQWGDPTSATVISKFDAYDVVSSLRWSPTESQISWTTDSGDFQLADVRMRCAQLQVPLGAAHRVDNMGGLFAHEYMSPHNVVLGFEQGDLVLIDTRMPRSNSCYAKVASHLQATGEIRRSPAGTFGFFGLGGFSLSRLDHFQSVFKSFELPSDFSRLSGSATTLKASGDFSHESGDILAVSDNRGLLSIYNMVTDYNSVPRMEDRRI